MVIVDSSVFVDFFNGVTTPETEWLDLHLERERLGLTSLILTEVLMGMRDERQAALIADDLMAFELIELHERELALDAARHYRLLRTSGRTVRKTIDLLIATHCIRHHHALLHRDRDFDAFEERLGLKVVHP